MASRHRPPSEAGSANSGGIITSINGSEYQFAHPTQTQHRLDTTQTQHQLERPIPFVSPNWTSPCRAPPLTEEANTTSSYPSINDLCDQMILNLQRQMDDIRRLSTPSNHNPNATWTSIPLLLDVGPLQSPDASGITPTSPPPPEPIQVETIPYRNENNPPVDDPPLIDLFDHPPYSLFNSCGGADCISAKTWALMSSYVSNLSFEIYDAKHA